MINEVPANNYIMHTDAVHAFVYKSFGVDTFTGYHFPGRDPNYRPVFVEEFQDKNLTFDVSSYIRVLMALSGQEAPVAFIPRSQMFTVPSDENRRLNSEVFKSIGSYYSITKQDNRLHTFSLNEGRLDLDIIRSSYSNFDPAKIRPVMIGPNPKGDESYNNAYNFLKALTQFHSSRQRLPDHQKKWDMALKEEKAFLGRYLYKFPMDAVLQYENVIYPSFYKTTPKTPQDQLIKYIMRKQNPATAREAAVFLRHMGFEDIKDGNDTKDWLGTAKCIGSQKEIIGNVLTYYKLTDPFQTEQIQGLPLNTCRLCNLKENCGHAAEKIKAKAAIRKQDAIKLVGIVLQKAYTWLNGTHERILVVG